MKNSIKTSEHIPPHQWGVPCRKSTSNFLLEEYADEILLKEKMTFFQTFVKEKDQLVG